VPGRFNCKLVKRVWVPRVAVDVEASCPHQRRRGMVAAKHGQVGLMRAAAKEVADRRLRGNALHPGPTSTAFQDAIEMEATGLAQAEAAVVFNGMIPLGRHTTPEEIAQAALYLASDASAMGTASTFMIDGGLSG
jgi:NAD(P)-dependent dehydrogenase (short-subunit alcohol dehydrogenase family)